MRKNMVRIFALILVLAMAVGFLAMIPAQATDSNAVQIVFNNVEYGEKLSLMYAVYGEEVNYETDVAVTLYTDAACTQKWCDATYSYTATEGKVANCGIFIAEKGVPAQAIDTVLYAKATMGENSSLVQRYSVLEYLHKRLSVDAGTISAEQKTMYETLLNFAAAAQPVIYKTDPYTPINNYTYVHVDNGTYKGYATGMYLQGGTIALSDLAADGTVLSWNYQIVGGESGELTDTLTIGAQDIILTAELEEPSKPEGEPQEIVFNFGENVGTEHKDGSDIGTSKSYTEGDYTLALTNASKVYDGAFDLTGISCLKMGTSSVVGTFTFTVPENVSEVVIYAAKYKAKATKLVINGAEYTIDTSSDVGTYTAITVDTSSVKTVTVSTASGACRAMIDKIVFKLAGAGEPVDPTVPEETTVPTEPEATEPEWTKVVEDGTYAIVVTGTNGSIAIGETFDGKYTGVPVAVSDNVATGAGVVLWTVTNVKGGVTLYNGSQYLAYATSTNMKLVDEAYVWTTLQEGEEVYLDVSDEGVDRGLIYRFSSNAFGAFATSNGKEADYCRAIQFCEFKACEHKNTTVEDAKAATCGAEGYTGDKVCSDCGATVEKGQTLNPTGDHNYKEGFCVVCNGADPDYNQGGGDAALVEVTKSLTFDNVSKRSQFSTEIQVWGENGITLTNNKASSTNAVANYVKPARFYAKSNLVIEAGAGIKTIVFDCNSPSYATTLKTSIGTISGATVTASSDKVTITFNEAVEDITISLTGQVRMDAITVTYLTTES